jgi:hypothetical protein
LGGSVAMEKNEIQNKQVSASRASYQMLPKKSKLRFQKELEKFTSE